MKKLPITLLLAVLLFTFSQKSVSAKRFLPFLTAPSTSKSSVSRSTTRGVPISVRFRGDRLAIIATFSNINSFTSVSYTLSYLSRGIPQGVVGTIYNTDPNQTKEILFGTCSNGICRYDTGITNARFTVTTTLNSGLKVRRSFVLKV